MLAALRDDPAVALNWQRARLAVLAVSGNEGLREQAQSDVGAVAGLLWAVDALALGADERDAVDADAEAAHVPLAFLAVDAREALVLLIDLIVSFAA